MKKIIGIGFICTIIGSLLIFFHPLESIDKNQIVTYKPRSSNHHFILKKYNSFYVAEEAYEALKAMIKRSCFFHPCLTIKHAYESNISLENSTNEQELLLETLEHQTGLAIDFYTEDSSKNEVMWKWLEQHAFEFGFILRYPKGKEEITQHSYLPWHYRYVGVLPARIIQEEGLCLEEYIKKGEVYGNIES